MVEKDLSPPERCLAVLMSARAAASCVAPFCVRICTISQVATHRREKGY